jgi:hypothetical protein
MAKYRTHREVHQEVHQEAERHPFHLIKLPAQDQQRLHRDMSVSFSTLYLHGTDWTFRVEWRHWVFLTRGPVQVMKKN